MTGSVRVKGFAQGAQEEKNVWVEKRSEFGLEIVSLIEQGIVVEVETVNIPQDQCIKTSDMYTAFLWLASTPKLP